MKVFILSIIIIGCTFEEPRLDGKNKISVYEIICKHPKKGYVKHIVKKSHERVKPYKNRNSIWVFRDIKGVLVESSLGCYTDSTMKGFYKK